jgi:hypothetical protein
MAPEQKLGFLKDEYLKLQDQYEDFDRRSLTIKGWVAAGSAAAIAIGFAPEKSGGGLIWIAIALLSACFWYLEAYWKTFQYALSDRIIILEAHFRGDDKVKIKDPDPFQIYDWWFRSYRKSIPIYDDEQENRIIDPRKRILIAARQHFVMLPYAVIIAICVVGLARDITLKFWGMN